MHSSGRVTVGALMLTMICFIQSPAADTEDRINTHQLDAILLAVADEIYAYGYHVHYRDLDAAKVRIYLSPDVVAGQFWILYKLLPHGEVLRLAYARRDKALALLHRDPETGFPPTQGAATNTLYLDDDTVIRMKTTWRRESFSINPDAAVRIVEDAKRRQKLRYEQR